MTSKVIQTPYTCNYRTQLAGNMKLGENYYWVPWAKRAAYSSRLLLLRNLFFPAVVSYLHLSVLQSTRIALFMSFPSAGLVKDILASRGTVNVQGAQGFPTQALDLGTGYSVNCGEISSWLLRQMIPIILLSWATKLEFGWARTRVGMEGFFFSFGVWRHHFDSCPPSLL